jgi:hypothetical protein
MYAEYTAGQAVAQAELPRNAKAPQITNTMPCLSSAQLPEINDKIAADPTGFGAIYNARQLGDKGYNTCLTCGALRRSQLASGCNCRLTATQSAALKSNIQWPHTADPSA